MKLAIHPLLFHRSSKCNWNWKVSFQFSDRIIVIGNRYISWLTNHFSIKCENIYKFNKKENLNRIYKYVLFMVEVMCGCLCWIFKSAKGRCRVMLITTCISLVLMLLSMPPIMIQYIQLFRVFCFCFILIWFQHIKNLHLPTYFFVLLSFKK